MKYRKRKKHAIWHWVVNCPTWPFYYYEEKESKSNPCVEGESLCDLCREIVQAGYDVSN